MDEKQKLDEKPLTLKGRRVQKKKTKDQASCCIIHFHQNKSETKLRKLSETSFKKIKDTVELRQKRGQPNEKLSEICSEVPEQYSSSHGVHPWCYKTFTNTSRILKRKNSDPSDTQALYPSKKRRVSDQTILFPNDRCIFCDRGRIRRFGKEERLVRCQTKTAENAIKKAASDKQDQELLKKISGIDLLAREACYHSFCRKEYTRPTRQHDSGDKMTPEQVAHKNAFDYLCDHINDSIINQSNVERMSMLRERYLQFLMDNSSQFYNASYKTYKLKAKIMKHFGSQLQFWQPNYRSELVYATDISKGQAVESAFEVASSDLRRLEEAGLLLRRLIKKAHEESPTMPWPPTAAFLQTDTIQPPKLLQEFLTVLITGKRNEPSERSKRHTGSLAQDICYAVTRGQWTMPKHLLLGMSLRHLTGSAEVISMINRFGHCASYSALLELETAMCKNVVERPGTIPPTITPINNAVVHLCWDNFDLNEETPSGSGTTHTSHGIIIQEVSTDGNADLQINRTEEGGRKKSKDRSVNYVHQEIEPCFLKDQAEPVDVLAAGRKDASDVSAVSKAQMCDLTWLICRALTGASTQTVPAWAGWVTLTGGSENEVPKLSRVDYMPPIINPITENATVQHILKVSQQASREVGQAYTIVCFDLAVAKKAYALVWQQPQVFADVIVRMGGFHITCAFMAALGKYVRCSGFEEILIESGICASGSIEKVMIGKHYNRAIRVHKIVAEALERLLLMKFEETHEMEEEGKAVFQRLAHRPNRENLSEALSNDSCTNMLNQYTDFRDHVRKGDLGKTAKMWMQYLDFVWMLLRFQRATKENNFRLHLASLEDMCSLFFSYDHPNYARYTVVYILTMLNLDKTHPGAEELLKGKGISVNRSSTPSSRNAVDITIEQTINKHAKSQGGIIGFSRNRSAYYRWCTTRHSRASYLQATLELAEMDTTESSSHKDVRHSEISQSEEATEKVVKAITNFINPFDVDDKDNLYCLSSGAPATKDIEEDLLSVSKVGKEAKSTFIKERLVDKVKSFHAPLKRQKLRTFANLAKSAKVTGPKKNKQLTAERNVFGQLVLLSLKHEICMERVLSYPLGPVPWPLATSDGTPVKTDKSQLMHALENDSHHVVKPNQRHITYIIDGCALFQAQVALPTTFGELAENMLDQLPKVQRVDFITDKYEDLSIKATERLRRGSTKPHLISGSLTKIPRDWKAFLSCDQNKQSLISFLLKEWQQNKYAMKLQDRKIYFVCGDACYCLRSQDGMETITDEVQELKSTQEEADTRIVLHCLHSAEVSRVNDIIIRSPDTDVFVLLLHFAQNIEQRVLFDTGAGNRRRLIDIHLVINETGEDLCSALPALHAFSGCDSTSAFVRKGKKTVLKTIRRHPDYMEAFLSLGRSITIDEHTSHRLEEFCCMLYGGSAPFDINILRHEKFLQRFSPKPGTLLSTYSGIDMSLLPPCKDALEMHLKRANYQALVWYNAGKANPDIPSPCGQGWDMDDGQLSIRWTGGDLLPQELVSVLTEDPDIYGQIDDECPELENLDDIVFSED